MGKRTGGEGVCNLWEMGAEKQRRLQQVVCCREGRQLGGGGFGGDKEGKICHQPTCFHTCSLQVPKESVLSLLWSFMIMF